MAIYELNQLSQPCKSFKREAFKEFLELLERELSNYKKLSNGQQVFGIAQKVAKKFSEKYERIGKVLETNNPNCKRFYKLLNGEQLKALRDLFEKLGIEIETKPSKEVIYEYLCANILAQAPKLRVKNKPLSPSEGRKILERTCESGKLPSLINKGGECTVRVATVRLATSFQEREESDPLFLTFVMNFEPYGVISDLREGYFEEDIKQLVKEKVLAALGEREEGLMGPLSEYIDPKQELEEKEQELDRFVEDLFDAIDTAVRLRFILSYFARLLDFAKKNLSSERLQLLETLRENIKELEEQAQELGVLWNEVVQNIPVGLFLLEKITDYLTLKNFRRFLYTYKLKLNDIAQGAAKQFLGEENAKIKTRADYFKQALKSLEKSVNQLLKENTPAVERETLFHLLRWTKLVLKAYFFYSKTGIDREKLLHLKELIEELYALKEEVNVRREKELIIPQALLKKLKDFIKTLKKEFSFKEFNDLYEEIKGLAKEFLKEELFPDRGREFYVAVDLDTLAQEIARYIRTGEREPKTRLYPRLVMVLSEEERSSHTYILKVKGYARNLPMALEKKSFPSEGVLIPKRELKGWFNLTYEAQKADIELKHTYKLAFSLTLFALGGYISDRSQGLLLGAILPPFPYKADFIYAVNTALFFATHRFKEGSIQHFNWKEPKTLPINADAITQGASIKSPVWSNKVFVKIKNGLTSILSNLPHEGKNLGELEQPTAVIFLSNPLKVDNGLRALVGEVYLFSPKGEGKARTLFGETANSTSGFEVHRRTLFEVFDYIETPRGNGDNLKEKYFTALGEMLKEIGDLKKVYLIPPLPIYRGLSTKEVLYRELYSAEKFTSLMEERQKELKLLFSSYGVVYTPKLQNLKERIRRLLKKQNPKQNLKGSNVYIALNLFKNAERIVADNGTSKPLVVPKFAVIPLLSLQEDKNLFHHAFVYSSPLPSFVGEIYSDRLQLSEKDKKELVSLLGAIHLIRYEKYEEENKQQVKTLKRSPAYVYPERRSGDKNIFALTRLELGKETYWESLLSAYEVVKALQH